MTAIVSSTVQQLLSEQGSRHSSLGSKKLQQHCCTVYMQDSCLQAANSCQTGWLAAANLGCCSATAAHFVQKPVLAKQPAEQCQGTVRFAQSYILGVVSQPLIPGEWVKAHSCILGAALPRCYTFASQPAAVTCQAPVMDSIKIKDSISVMPT